MALSSWLRRYRLLTEAGQLELVFVSRREPDKMIQGRMNRRCVVCGDWKPTGDFPRNGTWLRYDCKCCHRQAEKLRVKTGRVHAPDEMNLVRATASAMAAWNALTRERSVCDE